MKTTLPCEIINANQGAIDNFSCKQCRTNIIKQLCILLGFPIGGIILYGYAFELTLYFFNIDFSMSVESHGFHTLIIFSVIWFLTNRLGFTIVDNMNYNRAYEHCTNHLGEK